MSGAENYWGCLFPGADLIVIINCMEGLLSSEDIGFTELIYNAELHGDPHFFLNHGWVAFCREVANLS
jgi:hypothetical protein